MSMKGNRGRKTGIGYLLTGSSQKKGSENATPFFKLYLLY